MRRYTNGIETVETILEYNDDGKLSQYTYKAHADNSINRFPVTYISPNVFSEIWYVKKGTGAESIGRGEVIHTIENGNIVMDESIIDDQNGRFFLKTIYEYDDKNSPYKNIDSFETLQTIIFEGYSKNNCISQTKYYSTSKNGDYILYSPPVTFEYTYNEDNYPITKTRILEGEVTDVTNYLYE